MKKNFLCKCLFALSLVLFFTVLMPIFPNGAVMAQASTTAKDKNDGYRLNCDRVKLTKSKTFTLKTYNVGDKAKVYFRSSNEEIASVNNDGEIYAKEVGDTVITVTIKDGSDSTSLTSNVTVTPPAVSIKFTEKSSIIIVGIGKDYSLGFIVKPGNTEESPKFTTSNENIVSVSPGGRVIGQSLGLARIHAYIDATDSDGSQKNDMCAVIAVSDDYVSKLQNYFDEHTELGKISDSDLINALEKFFNKDYDPSSSLISSLNRYLSKEFNLN